MIDYLFTGGLVVDGTGKPAFVADVAVSGDTIVKIGKCDDQARRVIDISGKIICPGFIDIHAHSELQILRDPQMKAKLGQGITTEVNGNCGIGVYPCTGDGQVQKQLCKDVLGEWDSSLFQSFDDYVKRVEQQGCGINTLFLVSHTALRCTAMGNNPNRAASDDEIEKMCVLLDRALSQGCIGFSSGLYYAPCLFAERKELLALLKVVASHDKIFAVHHRCEGDDVLSSLNEVLALARESGVKLEISHLKAIGKRNQDKVPRMLEMLEKARESGVRVLFDQYPYTYGSTSLFSFLPPCYLKLEPEKLHSALKDPVERRKMKEMMQHPDGWDSLAVLAGWEQVMILILESRPEYEMHTVAELASDSDPYELFFDLLAEEKGVALMADVTQSEESLVKILTHPLMCFGTDALFAGSLCHPRTYHGAVHLLSRYVKEKGVLSWESAIRKMTGETARRLGLDNRGVLKEGMKADCVVFSPETLKDRGSLKHPETPSEGLELVMVNGNIACRNSVCTGALSGEVIRR